LEKTVEDIMDVTFFTNPNGRVIVPPEMKDLKIPLGDAVYRLGIGGIHSSEQSVTHRADENHRLFDIDVTSFYPAIVLKLNLFPEQAGPAFVEVFKNYVDMRVKAKRDGDSVTANALKIAINGVYGKFGSKYSFLYSPKNIIQVTLTGQLSLLMLIEALESEGISVCSANTDGIVVKVANDKLDMMEFIVWNWEHVTGFETESVEYKSLHSRDVNNYVAIKEDGVKSKGYFSRPSLMKNPEVPICNTAVIKYLKDGTAIEDTIRNETDIREFVSVRTVRDGAVDQEGKYLGKVIRWYYAQGIEGPITHQVNGYKVPKSVGARALMDLPDVFPTDVDYHWYINEAHSLLNDLGVAIDEGEIH
jgi:hypothetical protein